MTIEITEGVGKTAAELRDMQVRVIAGLRRGASNEKLTIDHLRGYMLGMADALEDFLGDEQ